MYIFDYLNLNPKRKQYTSAKLNLQRIIIDPIGMFRVWFYPTHSSLNLSNNFTTPVVAACIPVSSCVRYTYSTL